MSQTVSGKAPPERNAFLDYAKGILIALVCVGHVSQFVVHQNRDFWDDPLFKGVYIFHMPLFMAIAGYLSHRGIATRNPVRYASDRAVSLILPILSWTALQKLAAGVVAGSLTLPGYLVAVIKGSLNGFWFLWALLGSILFTLAAQSNGRLRPAPAAMCFALALLIPDIGNTYYFKFMLPFFWLGFLMASAPLMETAKRLQWVVLGISAVGAAGSFLLWEKETYIYTTRMAFHDGGAIVLFRWMAGVVASTLALYAMWFSYGRAPAAMRQAVEKLGENSLIVYVLQTYAFMALDPLPQALTADFGGQAAGSAFAIVAGCALAFVCQHLGCLLSRNRMIGLLFFGRRPRADYARRGR